MSADFVWYFLSFKGRISRQEYWLGYVGLIVVLVLLVRPMLDFWLDLQSPHETRFPDEFGLSQWLPIWLAVFIVLWPFSAIYAKRLHDLNASGWWLLTMPAMAIMETATQFEGWDFLALAAVMALGAFPGTRGSNRFGDDPVKRNQ
jgi:uncharacterized membrane protein YhaH (DUF805 family)